MKRPFVAAVPHLFAQWDDTKNKELSPYEVTLGSNKVVWWKCELDDEHVWEARVSDRANLSRSGKSFCPFCSGYRLSKTNSLAYRHPEIAKYWHPTKNGDRTPENTVSGRFWWQCPHNQDHEWKNSIGNIVKNTKGICPFCAGRRQEFEVQYPDLVAEWHPTKNGELKPSDVTAKSGKSVWWKCPKGEDHEWQQAVSRRTAGLGCPVCSGYKVGKDNNLLACFPEVAAELHPTKNNNADPSLIYKHSNSFYWWQCQFGHEWRTKVNTRTRPNDPTGCPHCSNHTSKPELRLFTEFKALFPDTEHKFKFGKTELDVYIPSLNLALEFDGSYWHKDTILRDRRKNEFCQQRDIKLVRVRQQPLQKILHTDILIPKTKFTKKEMDAIVIRVFCELYHIEFMDMRIQKYLQSKTFVNDKLFEEYKTYLPLPPPDKTVLKTHPESVQHWDYERNHPLKPEHFTHGSNIKVFWKCPKDERHYHEYTIHDKTSKKFRCPVCHGIRATPDYNLETEFPEIAKEWHPTKNRNKRPSQFVKYSKAKVWWQCSKNPEHEWKVQISYRTRAASKCPYCPRTSKWKPCKPEESFVAHYPELIKQWHPTLNAGANPEEYKKASQKIFWWQCPNNQKHVWKAPIARRTYNGAGCPDCNKERLKRGVRPKRGTINHPDQLSLF